MQREIAAFLAISGLAVSTAAPVRAETAEQLTLVMRPQVETFLGEIRPFCGKLSIDGGNGKLLYYRPERAPPPDELKKYEALVEAGALRPYEHPQRPEWRWFERTGIDVYEHPGLICYGRRVFAGIVEFTPERQIDCWRLRDLKYRYRVAGVPAWAKHPSVAAAFPDLPRFEGEIIDRELPMMFLEGGWKLHYYDPVHALYICDE